MSDHIIGILVEISCPACNGTGLVKDAADGPFPPAHYQAQVRCHLCTGSKRARKTVTLVELKKMLALP